MALFPTRTIYMYYDIYDFITFYDIPISPHETRTIPVSDNFNISIIKDTCNQIGRDYYGEIITPTWSTTEQICLHHINDPHLIVFYIVIFILLLLNILLFCSIKCSHRHTKTQFNMNYSLMRQSNFKNDSNKLFHLPKHTNSSMQHSRIIIT